MKWRISLLTVTFLQVFIRENFLLCFFVDRDGSFYPIRFKLAKVVLGFLPLFHLLVGFVLSYFQTKLLHVFDKPKKFILFLRRVCLKCLKFRNPCRKLSREDSNVSALLDAASGVNPSGRKLAGGTLNEQIALSISSFNSERLPF